MSTRFLASNPLRRKKKKRNKSRKLRRFFQLYGLPFVGDWQALATFDTRADATFFAESISSEYLELRLFNDRGTFIRSYEGAASYRVIYEEIRQEKLEEQRKRRVVRRLKKRREEEEERIFTDEEIEEELETEARLERVVEKPKLERYSMHGNLYLRVEGQPIEYVLKLLTLLFANGVKRVRFIREVPVSPKYKSGTASTNWRGDLTNLSAGQLYGFVGSMFVPGVEELTTIVVIESELPPGLLE